MTHHWNVSRISIPASDKHGDLKVERALKFLFAPFVLRDVARMVPFVPKLIDLPAELPLLFRSLIMNREKIKSNIIFIIY